MKKTTIMSALLLMIFLMSSCEEKESTAVQTMDEVYQSEGIPVNARVLENEEFSTYLSYAATLQGLKESTKYARISDSVESLTIGVGDYVEKNQILMTFPKSNPGASYYQSEAAFKSAEQAFIRLKSLFDKNGISRQDYDNAKTQYEVQLANWRAVRDMVEVKSPLAGYVTQLNVKVTDDVRTGDSLFTISNYNYLSAIVWVSDQEALNIRKGQNATALWEGKSVYGTVTQVDLSKDRERKAFAVHLNFSNLENTIPSGVTADVNIETKHLDKALVIHRGEMLNEMGSWYVFLNDNDHAKKQFIELGDNQGFYYTVESGLNAQDILITEGLTRLRDKTLIRIVNPDSARLAIKE